MKRSIIFLSISVILLNLPFNANSQMKRVSIADQIAAPELIAPIAGAK